ncbi:MAG: O-antigen ligase family protein [Solirubrobacterales bacterium]
MTPLATSHDLMTLGMVVTTAAVIAGLLARDARLRAAAGVAVLVLAPLALLTSVTGDNESSLPHVSIPLAAAAAIAGLIGVGGVTALFMRWPRAVLPAALATLPFRVPLEIGGQSIKLLLPLYLVIAGAVFAYAYSVVRDRAPAPRAVRLLDLTLAVFLGLYAVQSAYSPDPSVATQNLCFFYAPFALLYGLAKDQRWDAKLLRSCLATLVLVALPLVFAGYIEFARRQYLISPGGIKPSDFDPYFRVQSLFFDPNIYGRFVAIVMIAVTALLLFTQKTARVLVSAVVLALLWVGLVLSESQSSFAALLAGLVALACMRWQPKWVLGLTGAALVLGAVFVLAFPSASGVDISSDRGLEKSTSGRFDLVNGGIDLWSNKPVFGYGSGGFASAFEKNRLAKDTPFGSASTTKSHTAPLTVAAEQGLVGLAAFIALLIAGFAAVYRRVGLATTRPGVVARIAVAAAFTALFVHSLAYAAFIEDPLTWVMLGAAVSLAVIPRPGTEPAETETESTESSA